MNCKTCQSAFPDLLNDEIVRGESSPKSEAAARAHLESCGVCANELAELQATFALLDTWSAPEVSPFFDQKLAVLLREEQAAPPVGWFERLKVSLLLNTGRQFRPALVGAMALVLVIGGGTFGISTYPHTAVPSSAAVQDLQILNKNEQALQQMDQLLQDDASTTEDSSGPPLS